MLFNRRAGRSTVSWAIISTLLIFLSAPVLADQLTNDSSADSSPEPTSESTAAETSNPDPWEGFNRKMFAFDMQVDRFVLKPAAKGYRTLTPSWGQRMTSRFFANLNDLRSSFNAVLQARFGQAGSNFARFVLNTSMGVGGLFDVASDAGLKSHKQDFGLTLARWGMPQGPYLVLPFLGPSTARATVGLLPDSYTWPVHYLRNDVARYGLNALYAVDRRASMLDLEKSIFGDKYTFVRDYYLQSRALAAGKEVEDDFGAGIDDESEWGEAPTDDEW